MPTEVLYSSYLYCNNVAALFRTRVLLSWMLYKHMEDHGPCPEVLEVVSKSHRHFLI